MLPLRHLPKYILKKGYINDVETKDLSYTKSLYNYYAYDTIYYFAVSIDGIKSQACMSTNNHSAEITVNEVFMKFKIRSNKFRFISARDQRNVSHWVYLYPKMQKISIIKNIKSVYSYTLKLIYHNGNIKYSVISPMVEIGKYKQISNITLEYDVNHMVCMIAIQYCGQYNDLVYKK